MKVYQKFTSYQTFPETLWTSLNCGFSGKVRRIEMISNAILYRSTIVAFTWVPRKIRNVRKPGVFIYPENSAFWQFVSKTTWKWTWKEYIGICIRRKIHNLAICESNILQSEYNSIFSSSPLRHLFKILRFTLYLMHRGIRRDRVVEK